MRHGLVTGNWQDSCCFSFFIWQRNDPMTAKTKQTTVQTFHRLCLFFAQFVIPRVCSHYFYFIFNEKRATTTLYIYKWSRNNEIRQRRRSITIRAASTRRVIWQMIYRFAYSTFLWSVQCNTCKWCDGYWNAMKRVRCH